MKKKYSSKSFLFFLIFIGNISFSQIIYQHNFGTATFTAVNPYGVAPTTIDANLSASQWQTSFASGFNSLGGSTGQALSISNSGGTPTYSLSFTVGSGFNCDVTGYSFWRQRSAAGAQNWTLTVNGVTTIGAGATPTVGANTGTLAVSNAANGLSGTVNVVLQLAGATSTGTFRLDDFTLLGSVYPVSTCASPTLQATSYNATAISNLAASVNWTSGSGSSVIVLARQGSAVNTSPVSGVTYTANTTFGSGQLLGSGNYVVYNGPGTSVNVTGLSPATNYHFSVFEYNTTSGTPCYLVPGLTGNLTTTGIASGLQIRGILVDACNGSGVSLASEPYNEMVNFRTGTNSLPISSISIAGRGNTGGFNANKWPNAVQLWHGLVENANTASKVATLNSSIVGCGYIKEPTAGVIPANQEVIMVTSQYISTTLNSFSNLNDTIYMVFQDTVTDAVQGHFANYNATPGTRSLAIFDNLNGFSDTVTYDISLLTNISGGNGDAVDYDNAGHATYVNRGCQAAFMPLSVDAGTNNNVCFNSNSLLTATVSGTYNGLTWSGGAGSFSSTSATTTSYTPGAGETGTIKIYCTVVNNCPPKLIIAKDSVMLTILQLPLATISALNGYSLCPSATSVMSYSVTNPTFAGTVNPTWSSPSSTNSTYTVSSPSGTASVTYTLNLANACGSSPQTFTVYPLALPTVTLSATSPTACSGNTVVLSATSNSGNYSWNNPVSTNSTVVISSNTSTTGVVTTTNSCGSANDTYTLTITPTPTLSVDNSNVSLCSGQSATVTASSNVSNYTWSPGAITTNTYVVNAVGIYTVEVSNICGITSTTVDVTVNSVPTVSVASTSASMCASGQTATLSLSGSTGTYTWSNGGSSSSTIINAPGVYTATVTTPSCGSATTSITIGTISIPTISISAPSNTVCSGSSIILTANSSDTNYSWSDGSTTQTVSVNTPSIVVTTTNACGSAQDTFTLSVIPLPTVTVSPNVITLCSGQSATVQATTNTAVTYTWSTTANTSSVSLNSAGVYTLDVSNVCGIASATVNVSISSAPTLSISSTAVTMCASGETATLSLTGSTGTYSWSTGVNTATTLISSPGVYSATVSTPGCGSAVANISLGTTPLPVVSIASPATTSLCAGGSVTLTANSNAGNYLWPGGITTNTFIANSSPIVVTSTNACGGSQATQTLIVISTPTVSVTPSSNILCPGTSATLTATGNPTNYQWSTGDNTSVVLINTPGIVTVSVSNTCGIATASANISSINFPPLVLTSNSNTICPNETATLTVTGGVPLVTGNPVLYSWSNSSTTGSVVTSNGGNVTVSNTNVCGTNTASINVSVVNLNASISANPMSGITPVVVDFTNNSVGANTYSWDFGNGQSANTQTVSSQTYSVVGMHTVYLVVTNGSCSDIDSLTINVLNQEGTIVIPNVFTPNGDSINDIFRITGFNIVDFNCTIFDRWGLQMFAWEGIKNGWNGKSNDKDVPAGTYFFIINAKDIDNKEVKKQGAFSLFR